jgi:hypothetical protein
VTCLVEELAAGDKPKLVDRGDRHPRVSVQRIRKAHGLAPHRVRRFMLSKFSELNGAGEVRFRTAG